MTRISPCGGSLQDMTYGYREGADRGSESGSNGNDGGKSELHLEVLGGMVSWKRKQEIDKTHCWSV